MPASDSEDPLDRDLREWKAPEPPRDLESQIWRRVDASAGRARRGGWDPWILRAAAAVLCMGVGAVAVGLAGEWRLRQLQRADELHMARDYERLLEPAGDEAEAGLDAGARLDRDLGWLRRELKLSPEQFAQLKSLHEDSAGRLQLLAAELSQARLTEAHWDAERKNAGTVDFLSYGFAVHGVEALDQMSTAATRGLVDSTAALLDQAQRQRYLRLLGLAGSGPGGSRS